MPSQPPAYLIENVAIQLHPSSAIAVHDVATVNNTIGRPILLDAAQLGSSAHKLRNYWTNLASVELLQASLQVIQRPADRTVQSILPHHRICQIVAKADQPPHYVCNVPGERGLANYHVTYWFLGFRPGQPGSIIMMPVND